MGIKLKNSKLIMKMKKQGEKKMAEEKKTKKLSIFLRIVIALLIILVLIVGVAFFYVKGKLDKIQRVELPSDEDLGITETTAQN